MIGIVVAQAGIHTTRKHKSAMAAKLGANNGRVTWSIAGGADQRLHHAASLDFMIVLTNDPVLARYCRIGQDFF